MSEATLSARLGANDLTNPLVAAGYAVLGSILCWSRLVGLDHGYASDELMTVDNYVTAGPREILIGHYVPNNHELFSLLGWATTAIVGESEVALRLWSVMPFIVGAIVVTTWLHVRLGALSGLLFLYFATASPLLLDITRQARGYGIAFLAMSVLVVAALEAARSRRAWAVVAFCGAGVVGTWTLPHFGIAFAATGLVLMTMRPLRKATAVGLAMSFIAVIAWYLPHLDDLATSSRQAYGAPIGVAWIVTAPIDQILTPGLRWIDEVLVAPALGSLAMTAALAVLVGSSPLLRSRSSALILVAGPVVTVVILWLTRTNVAPRFFSFLLVPLFALLASGIASIVRRSVTSRRIGARLVLAMTTLVLVALIAASYVRDIPRLPREAVKDTAAFIEANASTSTPVFAYVPYPRDLEHYLGRPVETPRTAGQLERMCESRRDVIYVSQPWILPPVTVPCTQRDGARHLRFEQYARGGEVNIWLIPREQ